MKEKILYKIGKKFMNWGRLHICIIDDFETYFNPLMLEMAAVAGFPKIERYYLVDEILFKRLQKSPPDILILDIKDITKPEIAKDGFAIASLMFKNTNAYIAITSAHQFYLSEYHKEFDYIIQQRNLTGVDFIEELFKISDDFLNRKIKIYKKVFFRVGLYLVKKSTIPLS